MRYGWGFFGGNGMMGGSWLGALLMGLLWLVIVVAIIFLIVRLVRRDGHMNGPMMHGAQHGDVGPLTPPAATPHDEAVAIARKRFASGEITKEQFDEIVKALG